MVEQLAMACKRSKTGKANFADSSTGSAEQPAEQWSIWEAEEQVFVPTVKLTHTRPLPLWTIVEGHVNGSACHGVYQGHGASKIVYRFTHNRVLKLCEERDREPDIFEKGQSVGAYPKIHASNECTIFIT